MIDISRLPHPEPAAGMDAYIAERTERLQRNRATWENWQRYLKANRGEASVDYLPVKLDIENVSRCNFACTMCAVSKWPKRQRADDMSLKDFRRLLDEQFGLVEIKLNGLGEPTMQGDDFFEMIRIARARRIWVRITTNASLLHLRENYKELIGSGVNEIDISVDGADAPTFQGIRIGSDFDRVTANCRLLNDYAKLRGHAGAKMWTLVQKRNAARLAEHVALAAKLGFPQLVFSLQLHGWGDEALAERNAAEQVALTTEDCIALLEEGLNLGVRVAFWDVAEKFEPKPGKRCPWPFERAVVTSDLRTVPCCMIGDPDKFEIAKSEPFLEAWRGEEYRAFRQAHLDGVIPSVCKACYR